MNTLYDWTQLEFQKTNNMTEEYRTCVECALTKRIDLFPVIGGRRNKNRLRRFKCKSCTNLYHKKLREKPNIKDTIRRVHLRKTYGITLHEYDQMLEAQNFLCAICGKGEFITREKIVRRLTIDHDHVTGKVRGLLCGSCNVALGYFRESAELLKAAITYLEKHKPL